MRNEEYDTFLKDTEAAITRLAALYDQWFMGFERLEPHVARRDVEKRLEVIRKSTPNNTALKFRSQTLIQRWTTLREHWSKVARQIEEGTYRRDVMRARQRAAQASVRPPKREEVHELSVDDALASFDGPAMDALLAGVAPSTTPLREDERPAGVVAPPPPRLRADEAPAGVVAAPPPRAPAPRPGPPRPPTPPAQDTAVVVPQRLPPAPPPPRAPGVVAPPARPAVASPTLPVRPAPPAPARPAPPPPAPAPATTGVAEPRLRALYDQYVQKRRENNERVDNVKYESLAASIQKMVPDLEKKHQGKKIDFEVVVKDGKVGLKPVTR